MTFRPSAPHKGPRWLVLVSIVALLSSLTIGAALAVHDSGAFELDIPSADAQDGVGSSTAGDDWDLICKANLTTCTFQAGLSPSGTATASSSSHVADVLGSGANAGTESLQATIFTGGGSKDGQDISAWLWKDNAGGLPDKDNLLHAYAARYTKAASTTCLSSTLTCELIYFGSDRYANDGDATQAFWFLQNQVTVNGASEKGGTHFTGVHKNGDLLIISEFSNGGTTSTITVYKWVDGALVILGGGDDQACGLQASDPFCGIVNTNLANTVSPWTFLDKAGSTSFRQGEFYESGINLSDPSIALSNECFSSFVAETRSSTSVTATLKDFVLGQFQSCVPAMTTTASTNGTILPGGTSVTDTARITVTGANNPADPTGTVTFFLCKDLTGCPSPSGTNIGTGDLANQTGGTVTDGIAEATSPAVNTAASPLQPGRYCFRAEWPGSTTYPGALSHTNNVSECFTVQDTSTVSSVQNWLPNDSATVTSGSGNTPISGTLSFTLYSGDNCGATSGSKLYPVATASEDFTLTSATSLADRTKTTTNTSVKVTAAGSTTVSWKVVFTPTAGSGIVGDDHCEKTTLNITN